MSRARVETVDDDDDDDATDGAPGSGWIEARRRGGRARREIGRDVDEHVANATHGVGRAGAMTPASTGAPVVLVLVGPSGSGKSTFSERLRATGRWTVSNQDTVRDGRRGTRRQCVSVAKRGVCAGKHVVIDRCGLSREQREDFVALAKASTPPCDLHCVWFNQPTTTYQERARARRNHPGGVEGDGAVRVVQMQMRCKDNAPPTKEEGFRTIRRCRFQDDVDAALGTYRMIPPSTVAVEFPKHPRTSATKVEPSSNAVIVMD